VYIRGKVAAIIDARHISILVSFILKQEIKQKLTPCTMKSNLKEQVKRVKLEVEFGRPGKYWTNWRGGRADT
jgi:hypothetical protein